jgi:hypothetical protein
MKVFHNACLDEYSLPLLEVECAEYPTMEVS